VYFSALLFHRKDSVIIIQKVFTNGIYANALKFLVIARKKNTVFDLDDAEYVRHPAGTLNFFLKNCSSVTVGSNSLKDYALKFNKNVFLNTSPVISHNYLKSAKNERLAIGWIGDFGNGNKSFYPFSHKKSLFELFFPSLEKITIPVKLVLLGISNKIDNEEIRAYFSENKNLELEIPEKIDWQDEDWVYDKIKDFDIGIAPMVDHEFNRAKSAFKVKQYLSCGVPVLASSTGENASFVKHGINGFLCDSPEDYTRYLNHFARISPDDYKIMSDNAFNSSLNFRTGNYCEKLIDEHLRMIVMV